MDGNEKKAVQAVDLPALTLAKGVGAGRTEHEIFVVAVGRMAKTSTKLAVLALNKAVALMTKERGPR